jgi:DNA-binding CsgD family transcriptional regulator
LARKGTKVLEKTRHGLAGTNGRTANATKPAVGQMRHAPQAGIVTANTSELPDIGALQAVLPAEKASSRRLATSKIAGPRQLQAHGIAAAFGVVGSSAAVLSTAGNILAVNELFEALVPSVVRKMHGRPQLTDPAADRQVRAAIERLDTLRHGATAQAIPIRIGGAMPTAIAYISPVSRAAREVLAGIGGILVIVPLRSSHAPSPKFLQQLFGLSGAEARVASCIAARKTVEAIADEFGVGRETVRSQLKAVLAKTETKRQLDLAVMLTGLQPPSVT